jgi:hypothetical protein
VVFDWRSREGIHLYEICRTGRSLNEHKETD